MPVLRVQTTKSKFTSNNKLKLFLLLLGIYIFAVFIIILKIKSSYVLESTYGEVDVPVTTISSPVNGIITQLNVKNGDVVNQGDTLMVISSLDLQQKLQNFSGKLDSFSINNAYSLISSDQLVIKAPADGVISDLVVVEGMNTNASQTLANIFINQKYAITGHFQLNIKQYLNLQKYSQISVEFADQKVPAEIVSIGSNLDPNSGEITIQFQPKQNLNRALINQEKVKITLTRVVTPREVLEDIVSNIKLT